MKLLNIAADSLDLILSGSNPDEFEQVAEAYLTLLDVSFTIFVRYDGPEVNRGNFNCT
jgi:hypothetical protein